MSVVFVINPGAASKKYALYEAGRMRLSAVYEKNDTDFLLILKEPGKREEQIVIDEALYRDASIDFKKKCHPLLLNDSLEVTAIGVRVLASGTHFQEHRRVDDVFLSLLREKEPTAPLHIPTALSELQECRTLFPGVPVVAVSDTTAFRKLPQCERSYSIDQSDAESYDLYRFGYHGLSVQSVIDRAHAVFGCDPERMIVCHIGSGMSVTGVRSQEIVSTSGGYTSLTGLPMLSRAGDVDAGVVLELLRLEHGSHQKVHERLHRKGGLEALIGSSDLRHALQQKSQGNKEAIFALDCLSYHIQKAIAAASVATGGIDALVFTGTIGQRSPEFRQLVTESLKYLGIAIEEDKNNAFLGRDGVISPVRALVKTAVILTDEMAEIAQSTLRVVESRS